jgi:hypothetical protein
VVGALTVIAAVSGASAAAAQAMQMVRGVVTEVAPDRISVRPARGKPVVVGLSKDWRVSVTTPIRVTDIKPGSFIGSAEMPQADGVGRSLEVHVFPPGVKLGEGHYGWDKKKGSMMTNGTVGQIKVAKGGQELEVDYGSGKRRMIVPKSVPVVQITGGDRAQLRKGASVFLIAAPRPDGGLVTNSVSIGANGSRPPM